MDENKSTNKLQLTRPTEQSKITSELIQVFQIRFERFVSEITNEYINRIKKINEK